ncbi:MAG: 2-phospho-L-lactate guanylyltransferase [Anaerolineales bacterium]|nr:2-phospho-L-lactate guanylyltransferase [Anaerolineales bacterium]
MSLWAIVPVKPLRHAKSRLSGLLTPAERSTLARSLLARTLDVLTQAPELYRRLVISRDPEALAVARQHQALTMTEPGAAPPDLNAALSRATQVARSFGASAVLVVPGDLPQLLAEDVAALLALDGAGPRMVIAPDRHETGTNALLVRPPGWLAYAFGAGSFQAHQALAAEARAAVSVLRRPGLAFDLDTPEDWRLNREYTLAHIPLELTRRPL